MRTWSQPLRVERTDITSPVAGALIAALNGDLTERYPEDGACHFRLDADEVAEGHGAFVVGYVDTEAVACGAVRRLDPHTAEIKRMYVAPSHRGKRFGAVVLGALGMEARRLGATRLVLETGDRNPEALTLYGRAGFVRIPPFGEYVSSPLSVCMSRELGRRPPRPISPAEIEVVRVAITRSSIKPVDARALDALPMRMVVGECGCGCASVDFEKGEGRGSGIVADAFGVTPLGNPLEILIWGHSHAITAIEVVDAGGNSANWELPLPDSIRPWEEDPMGWTTRLSSP